MCAKLLQSCLTLYNTMDLPGSSVHGILQAKTLEWIDFILVAMGHLEEF